MTCYAAMQYYSTGNNNNNNNTKTAGDTIVIILFKGLIWVPYFRIFDFLVVPANNIKRTGRERGKKEKGFLFSLQTKNKKSYFEN